MCLCDKKLEETGVRITSEKEGKKRRLLEKEVEGDKKEGRKRRNLRGELAATNHVHALLPCVPRFVCKRVMILSEGLWLYGACEVLWVSRTLGPT